MKTEHNINETLDGLETMKGFLFLCFVAFFFVLVGQFIQEGIGAQQLASIKPGPTVVALALLAGTLVLQITIKLIEYGSGKHSSTQVIDDDKANTVLANIHQARIWLDEAAKEFDGAQRTLNLAYDALDAAEAKAK